MTQTKETPAPQTHDGRLAGDGPGVERRIVRQAALASAINAYERGTDVDTILATAGLFAQWIWTGVAGQEPPVSETGKRPPNRTNARGQEICGWHGQIFAPTGPENRLAHPTADGEWCWKD